MLVMAHEVKEIVGVFLLVAAAKREALHDQAGCHISHLPADSRFTSRIGEFGAEFSDEGLLEGRSPAGQVANRGLTAHCVRDGSASRPARSEGKGTMNTNDPTRRDWLKSAAVLGLTAAGSTMVPLRARVTPVLEPVGRSTKRLFERSNGGIIVGMTNRRRIIDKRL